MKKLLILSLLVSSACSNLNEDSRKTASEEVVSKEDYYAKRGSPHAKFRYDGYRGNFGKAVKSVFSKGNIGYMGVASDLRQNLFENSLFDTGTDNGSGVDCNLVMKRIHRSPMGRCYFNGLERVLPERDKKLASEVMMGSLNQRFGRNSTADMSNKSLREDMLHPNPLEISRRLFARKDGKTREAKVINVLASAWLQAMNHDWFTHGKNSKHRHTKLPADPKHPHFKDGMKVPETRQEAGRENTVSRHGYTYTSRNQVTHWWDASQIYGSDAETIAKVRGEYDSAGNYTGKTLADGKVAVDDKKKRLIYSSDSLPVTGFHDNWWTGLELIHTIFHLEHNHIIDEILKPQVGKSICKLASKEECGDILFEKARMINSALIAKIHTVEWTPALLDNSTLHLGMRANWYGFKEAFGVDATKLRGLFNKGNKFKSIIHLLSGLVGENTLNLYSTPFTLTEEFVAVYRMHPLIPEKVTMRSAKNSKYKGEVPIKNMIFRDAPKTIAQHSTADWMLSFGTSHPGGMLLHNYPTFMMNLNAERNTGRAHGDATRMDMGAIDIFRDRERGVPRYNDLRRALKLPPAADFTELVAGPAVMGGKKRVITPAQAEDIKTLEEIYNGDIEKLDLLVGTLAEADRYPGYAFGNTPFYIFALMASRRLMVDPFFSDYYTPKYYTQAGIDHVQDQTMVDVLVRHFPELKGQFYNRRGKQYVKNAFRPWGDVYKKVESFIKNN
jgi:hypothetical protein